MFSGIGGFEIALNKLGHKCVGYSEIDKTASDIYRKHFPSEVNYGDATKINEEQLPKFDLLVGGFPCQAFSIAGKRRGFEDTRGTLFFDIARIVKSRKPRYLLLENVRGLLSHQGGETFRVILNTLGELGYSYQWGVVNSRYFGIPQNRERVFIVGHLTEWSDYRPQIFPYRESADEISSVVQKTKNIISPCITTENAHIYGCNVTVAQTYAITKCNNISVTEDIENGILRRLTPTECERLMGFPDDWTKNGISSTGKEYSVADTKRYKVLGNAVVTNVIYSLCKNI
jgi:DNA (cytosine-5)-methyltransferase 1